MAELRLQKLLAERGLASRRTAEEWIAAGRVQVNGVTVREMGQKVNAARDRITVDGQPLPERPKLRYILLHKPVGYLCSVQDERGKQSVLRLLPAVEERIYPVGRLDYDSSGLLLLSNDGALTQALLHPARQVDKTYHAQLRGPISVGDLNQLRQGVKLEEGLTAPAQVKLMKRSQGSSSLEITIHEGRNRQVRRMCAAVGHPVTQLRRIRFGPLTLGRLKPGEWRELSPAEVRLLHQATAPVRRASTPQRPQRAVRHPGNKQARAGHAHHKGDKLPR